MGNMILYVCVVVKKYNARSTYFDARYKTDLCMLVRDARLVSGNIITP